MKSQIQYWDELADRPLDASVIDPQDVSGYKNHYLAEIRNFSILAALEIARQDEVVLDLGCGTGSLSAALVGGGWRVLGLDISPRLIHRSVERDLGDRAAFALYDGLRFPLSDRCVTAVTTYVVLTHVLEDDDLNAILAECRRVLRPGGLMICIEQARRRPRLDRSSWKFQRSRAQWIDEFESAGLELRSQQIVRFGRFPTTPLIRYGLIPARFQRSLASLERGLGRLLGVPPTDYCDILFELQRRD